MYESYASQISKLANDFFFENKVQSEHEKVTCDPTLPKPKQVEQQKRKAAEGGDTLLVPKRIKTVPNGNDSGKVISLKKKVHTV